MWFRTIAIQFYSGIAAIVQGYFDTIEKCLLKHTELNTFIFPPNLSIYFSYCIHILIISMQTSKTMTAMATTTLRMHSRR